MKKTQSKPLQKLKDLALKTLKKRHPTIPSYAIPLPKYSDKTTNGLTKCVIDWIEFNGYQAERVNSMGRRLDNRKTIKDILGAARVVGSVKWIKGSGQVGTADISSTIKGKAVKIEVKCKATQDNKQSEAQKEYQKKIEAAGGVYVIARTFQDFYHWYLNFVDQ